MKIWIDLDNSPHVLFFKPIIDRLRAEGIETLITVRSFSQTEELASQHGLSYSVIGEHRNPRHFATRAISTMHRARQLANFVRRHRPDVAVSHGSRALVIAAWCLGIPSMTLYDYEFVSAGIFNKLSKQILVPAIISPVQLQEQGLNSRKFRAYPGLKEEVYIYDFKPNPGVLRDLKLDPHRQIITVRPPADWAHYHDPKSEQLFGALIERLRRELSAQVIVVPRTRAQCAELTAQYRLTGAPFRLLDEAVDGLSLMWFSDAVFSGGGTMVREAALLGVNVYSTFAGKLGAADKQLALEGKLTLIRDPAEFDRLSLLKRTITNRTNHSAQGLTKQFIVRQIIDFASEYAQQTASPVPV